MTTSASNDQISTIIQQLNEACTTIQESDMQKEAARVKALAAARDLTSKLENPTETVLRHAFSGPDRVCVRLAIQLGLFHTLTKRNGMPITATDLAASCDAEVEFIVRIMRVLIACKFVGEAGPETYIAIPITRVLTITPMEAAVRFMFDHSLQQLAKMPEYFAKNGYKSPTDPHAAPLQYAFNTDLLFGEFVSQNPPARRDFDTFMTAHQPSRVFFPDWFPVQEQIMDGFDGTSADSVLLVDVGGGRGQDVLRFKERFPNAPGRLILQDLPNAVEHAVKDPKMEVMEHDFLKPQPIKGARLYFLHFILHNWPTAHGRTILSNLATAMTPGYSKVIINDYILPATDCPLTPSWADWHMMGAHGALERSEKQWKEVAEGTGLRIVKFWLPEGGLDGAVELMLA